VLALLARFAKAAASSAVVSALPAVNVKPPTVTESPDLIPAGENRNWTLSWAAAPPSVMVGAVNVVVEVVRPTITPDS